MPVYPFLTNKKNFSNLKKHILVKVLITKAPS